MSRENTFGGGPPACRVALECLAILEEENLLENVASVGAYLQQELKRVTETHAAAKEVRGRGFIQGVVLDIPARPIVEHALAQCAVQQQSGYRLALPASISATGEACGQGVRVLKKLLGKKRRAA